MGFANILSAYKNSTYKIKNIFLKQFCIMKYIYLIFQLVFVLSLVNAKAQTNEDIYYYLTSHQLNSFRNDNKSDTCQIFHINHIDKTFYIGRCWDFNGVTPEISNITSSGKTILKNGILLCIDKRINRTYRFKYVDYYTLEVLNNTAEFAKNKRLYLHVHNSENLDYKAISNIKDLFTNEYWNNGKRNGIFYWRKNDCHKYIFYRNNIGIDSIFTSVSDTLSTTKIHRFMNKY